MNPNEARRKAKQQLAHPALLWRAPKDLKTAGSSPGQEADYVPSNAPQVCLQEARLGTPVLEVTTRVPDFFCSRM